MVPLTGSTGGVLAIVIPRHRADLLYHRYLAQSINLNLKVTQVAIRTILKMGDPQLFEVSAVVDRIDRNPGIEHRDNVARYRAYRAH